MTLRLAVIVTSAGSSERFRTQENSVKKEFAVYNGHSVLYQACVPFFKLPYISALFVTYKPGTKDETREALEVLPEQKKIPIFLVEGGDTRQQSVFNALSKLNDVNDNLGVNFVAIHDGARPFVTEKIISDTVEAACKVGGAVPVLKVTDTIVKVDMDGIIKGAIDRRGVCRVQTPQVFTFPLIFDAHKIARLKTFEYTDDSQIFTDCGYRVQTVEGSELNRKITYFEDLK